MVDQEAVAGLGLEDLAVGRHVEVDERRDGERHEQEQQRPGDEHAADDGVLAAADDALESRRLRGAAGLVDGLVGGLVHGWRRVDLRR